MPHGNAAPSRCTSSCQRAGGIALNEHKIRLTFAQMGNKPCLDRVSHGMRRQARQWHLKPAIGRNAEWLQGLLKQRAMLTGRDQRREKPGALAQCQQDRRHLYRLGTCPDDGYDSH